MIKRFLFLFTIFWNICLHSQAATFTDLKFGQAQIADSQWNVSACMYTTTCQIYSKNPGTVYKIPWTSGQLSWTAGDYVAFVATGNATNPYNAIQYNSAGTQKAVMGTGHIINMSTDYFFFVGNDNNTGQLFSMTQGFANTSGVTWTGTLNPTVTQVNTLAASGSTTPLAAGQTAAPAAPPAPTRIAIRSNTAGVNVVGTTPTSYNSPGGEGSGNAFDGNTNTKYLNFDKYNAGVTAQLNQGRVVTSFTVTTANDFSGRDPTSYKLYGSNDGITWTLIQEGPLTLSENRFTISGFVDVTNTTAYVYYYIYFPTTKAGNGCGLNCDSMQISEITYYYWSDNTTTSSNTGNGTITDPVQAAATPPFDGTITFTNQSGATYSDNGSVLTFTQQNYVNTWQNKTLGTGNRINLDINGSNNILYIEQVGNKNLVTGIGQTAAVVQGSSNNLTVKQGTAGTGQNEIDLRVIGNTNTLSIGQARNNLGTEIGTNGHYQIIDIAGYQNRLTTQQSNSTLGGQYKETTISGNQNIITTSQTDNGNKIMFTTVNGNSNTVDAVQKGTGQHQLTTNLTGNNNSASVIQEGAQQNKATIDLTNVGGPSMLDLQQSGGKNFTIQQMCANPAGCTITVRQ
jgi:hypothetical protein